MKNLKIISLFLYTFLYFFFTSCKEQKSETKKYTIWIGSSTYAEGYATNSYKDSLNYLIFTKKDGTISIYNKKHIFRIDINKK